MAKLIFLIVPMLFCTMSSCKGVDKQTSPTTALQKSEQCDADSSNHYELYIPANPTGAAMPLLVIVDAHAAGKLAISKFKTAAITYHFILAASSTIKNGCNDYEQALNVLIDDVHSKYPVSTKLFLSGFSGGARMALSYATNHSSDGLLLCGALGAKDELTKVVCPVYSISGMDDFNFPETAMYLFRRDEAPANLKIELTHASHSWPDSIRLANAMGYLVLASAKDTPPDTALISSFVAVQKKRLDAMKKKNDLIAAALMAANMASVPAFDKDKYFARVAEALLADNTYNVQMNKLAQCLNNEMGLRPKYIQAFSNYPFEWWKTEIKSVNKSLVVSKDSFEIDMYRRIKAFWGIACYSLCKQAAMQHDEATLSKTLAIYRTIEPDNQDMFYFSAFEEYWNGNEEAANRALKLAVRAGFNDMNQLKSDFPPSVRMGL